MRVKVNGENIEIKDQASLGDLISVLSINLERVVVEHNKAIILQKDIFKVSLQEDDVIELVSFVGGG